MAVFLVFLGAISNFRESLFSSSRLASLRSAITSGLLFRHFDVRLGGCIEKRNKIELTKKSFNNRSIWAKKIKPCQKKKKEYTQAS